MTPREILDTSHTFAVVGLSPDPSRPSHYVAQVLRRHGYRVVPVNPHHSEWMGETCYPNLSSIPFPIDVVDIFRRSEAAGVIVDEAVRIGARVVWMQLGVIDPAATARARAAGLEVVVDRCPAIELGRG